MNVNGIDNVLEFIYGLRERGLTSHAQSELNFARSVHRPNGLPLP